MGKRTRKSFSIFSIRLLTTLHDVVGSGYFTLLTHAALTLFPKCSNILCVVERRQIRERERELGRKCADCRSRKWGICGVTLTLFTSSPNPNANANVWKNQFVFEFVFEFVLF